jgi:hypothetical protein
MTNKPTRDFRPIPEGCIKAEDLHSLARALHKLQAWHHSHGGVRADSPCLRSILVDESESIVATVQSGDLTIKMVLKDGDWVAGDVY